jgi:co-chaperonin GroES (HSP10)
MAINIDYIEGKLNPINENVLVSDMFFGEQITSGGLIITNDDGNVRGIYPRWGKVYAKGPTNTDPFQVGDWILIEHGRWTRKITIDDGEGVKDFQKVETKSILAVADERPNDFYIGTEYGHGDTATIRPEDFGAR